MIRIRSIATVAAAGLLLCAAAAPAGKKADAKDAKPSSGGYRGVDRRGVYPATGLVKEWPEDGPKLLWKYDKLGVAWGAVTVHDGRAYVLGGNNPGRLFCFDVESGKRLWAKAYGPDRKEGRFPGSRSTVEIADGRAYFSTGDGVIHCLDAEDGETRWSVDTVKQFKNKVPGHGWNQTPLIHDGKVICSIRRGEHTHVALDAKTGEVVWASAPSEYAIGDSSPVYVPHETNPLIVDNLWHAFVAIDPDTGKVVWTRKDGRTGTMMTPVYGEGRLFADMGRHRAVLLEVTGDPEAPFRERWQIEHGLDDISQALILDGKVFYLARLRERPEGEKAGKADKKSKRRRGRRYMALCARDLETGKLLQSDEVHESGSIAAADGMIYLVTGGEKGWNRPEGCDARISLFRVTDGGYELVSEFRPERCRKEAWVNCAIAEGRLFHRQGGMLSVYDLRPESYKD